MRVLLVEDYEPLTRSLSQGLSEAGYAVDTATDGEAGLSRATATPYDVILLDLMLPKLDGFTVLERLRAGSNASGVIILSARQELADRVKGLDLGADDYVVKPFAVTELVARIRALIRRRESAPNPVIEIADLRIDTTARTVRRGSKLITLSTREYALVEYLALHRGKIVTRSEILEHVYGFGTEPSSNVVDVYIGYLRRKIDQDFAKKLIHTRRGTGYMLGEAE